VARLTPATTLRCGSSLIFEGQSSGSMQFNSDSVK
jgi:hypothetical protein